MHWNFRTMGLEEVETGITQRDQFRTDDLDLAEALVRESVQNSLDAARSGNTVRVRFSYLSTSNTTTADFVQKLFEEQTSHALAYGLEVDSIDFDNPSALIVEDFGTKGLTGPTDAKDNDNFSDFWRRHGLSHKTGTGLGRWGLGKLVYSSSSQLRAFFGLTIRQNDDQPYLMGQTVLDVHQLGDTQFAPHGFFSDLTNERLQIPIADSDLIGSFSKCFGLTRNDEPGLSIVIPFPYDTIQLEDMIMFGITTYFFPILAGKLVLDFNDVVVDNDSLRPLAHKYAPGRIRDADELFDFVEEVCTMPEQSLTVASETWTDSFAYAFDETTLAGLRDKFSQGKTIGIRLPMKLRKKSEKTPKESYISAFLCAPPDLSGGRDLYVRGGITLPQEAKFHHRKAFAAMLATDPPVAEFLGDAETPAHNKWNGQAEKLLRKWTYPKPTLRMIRNSLVGLYDLLAQAIEEEEEDALLDFFWSPSAKASKKTKKKPQTKPTPQKIPAKPRVVRVSSRKGGFSLAAARDVTQDHFPQDRAHGNDCANAPLSGG